MKIRDKVLIVCMSGFVLLPPLAPRARVKTHLSYMV